LFASFSYSFPLSLPAQLLWRITSQLFSSFIISESADFGLYQPNHTDQGSSARLSSEIEVAKFLSTPSATSTSL
jgi:hypothetical protein